MMSRICSQNHFGGPGVRVGRGCVHAGPISAALVLGVITALAALSNGHIPWWGVVISGVFWPLFSFVGQVLL